jgi:alpha-mannosidase
MPHDTFKWRGIDGSEVLTHFITTPEPVADPNLFCKYTYNGLIEPLTIAGIYENYRNKDINKDLLISYGHGDGGGGVTREMLENRRRIDLLPGLPSLKTGRAQEYFEKLHTTIEETDNYVHTWDGELYLEYHRGTYTSQAFVKKWNRKLELSYREQELLHSWALLTKEGWQYPQDEMHEGWEIILRNQFHDIIPGSSIHEVYEDAQLEYLKAHELMEKMKEKFQSEVLSSTDNKWTIINSAGWKRSEILFIPVEGKGYFIDSTGNTLRQEEVRGGYNVYVIDVEPLSSQEITFVEGSPKEADDSIVHFTHSSCGVETPYYSITWDMDGRISGIFDKEHNRQVLAVSGFGNQFILFEDKPIQYDAWDIDLFHFQKSKTLSAATIDVKEATRLSQIVVFTYEFGESKIVQEMVVYADSRRIDFRTKVDWHERQQLLKVQFDVDIRSTQARYNIQYGSVKRPTHWNTSWDMARFESIAHQWVDFSERGYGVALLNDCKYGHNVKDQTMSLSLLKGPIYPDPDGDKGSHEFTYSLLPHSGDFLEGMVNEEAWSLNSPLAVLAGELEDTLLMDLVSDDAVMIDAFKLAEDGEGIILRLHDHTGGKRKISLRPNFEFDTWQEVNLLEKPLGDSKENTDREICLELGAFELKTILIKKEHGF